MKKTIRDTRAPQRMRTAELTQQDLVRAVGGHNGTIIVESALPGLQGIQGSGLQGIQGSG